MMGEMYRMEAGRSSVGVVRYRVWKGENIEHILLTKM